MGRKSIMNAVKWLFMFGILFCDREKPAVIYAAVVCAATHNFRWNRFPVFLYTPFLKRQLLAYWNF